VTVSRRKRRTHRIPGASVRGARRTACRGSRIPAETARAAGLRHRRARVRYALWRSFSRAHYRNRRHQSQTKYLHRLHAPGEWGTCRRPVSPGLPTPKSGASGARRQTAPAFAAQGALPVREGRFSSG